MWERFSYYGLRALLVLYMVKVFLFSDQQSYLVFGAYTAFVYMTPVIGGLIADKLIGYKNAVIFGGILIALGNVILATEWHESTFYLGLAAIIVGTGFFKGNISCIVGQLYNNNDGSRDAGYTIFYMGVNIGSFLATTVIAYVGETIGWHIGFAIAAIGMILGLITFLFGAKLLDPISTKVNKEALSKKFIGITSNFWIYLISFVTIPLFAWLIANPIGSGNILLSVGVLVLGYILYQASKCTPTERNHIFFILLACFLCMLFFSFFEQAGSSMTLFADRNVDRDFFGFELTAAMTTSFNPLFIVLLAPLFSTMWVKLDRAGKMPSIPVKFFFGLFFLALGFGALALGAKEAMTQGQGSLNWVILCYFLFTIGELFLSPIGLSMVSKLSPPNLVGLLMGTWFLATAFAQYIAGIIATLTNIDPALVAEAGATGSAAVYFEVFYGIFITALICSAFVLLITPLMKRLAKY
jgi:POT family proton-dependent oligopeptide transporter